MRLTLVAVLLLSTGCMTTSAHQAQLDALARERAAERQASAAKLDELEHTLADTRAKHTTELAARDASLEQTQVELAKTSKALDDAQALVGELKKRLDRLGQSTDALLGERGKLTEALADARARLEELRRQKAAADERAATFRGLVDKLKSMIDSGQLAVVVRGGKMLIVLPNDVLFDSGRTELRSAGKTALMAVAAALKSVPGRTFLVAGHTDDVPIHTAVFPSNWELSTARAVKVVDLFIEAGVPPTALAAAGYGEFDPVAPNDTPEHKAQNRRIEVELQPNLGELPSLENVLSSK